MIKALLGITLTFSSLFAFDQKRKVSPPNDFVIEKLADGVWAAINNDNFGKAICNAGIIDLGDKTLVYDPFMNPRVAYELKMVAEELTGKPVTIVVNSHFHNDHIRGNQVFVPQATIISTVFTRHQIARIEPQQQQWERNHAPTLLKATRKMMQSANGYDRDELPLWIAYYEGMMESNHDLKITLPDIVFTDSLWIHGSDFNVKLLECKDGHTPSDIALVIPSRKVAFMGDLLFVKRHPWLGDGNPTAWQSTLDQFYGDRTIDLFVPGHGRVAGRESLKELKEYITTLEKLAKTVDSDSAEMQLISQPLPAKYLSWHFGRFYESNLKFMINTLNKELTLYKNPE